MPIKCGTHFRAIQGRRWAQDIEVVGNLNIPRCSKTSGHRCRPRTQKELDLGVKSNAPHRHTQLTCMKKGFMRRTQRFQGVRQRMNFDSVGSRPWRRDTLESCGKNPKRNLKAKIQIHDLTCVTAKPMQKPDKSHFNIEGLHILIFSGQWHVGPRSFDLHPRCRRIRQFREPFNEFFIPRAYPRHTVRQL